MDRTKEQRIHVENSGQAIYKFISLLSAGLPIILAGDYTKYLVMLKKHFEFDETKVIRKFSKQVSFLSPEEKEPGLIVTFLLGEVLGDVRETLFKKYLQQIKRELKTQLKTKKKTGISFEDVTANAFERNDQNISLIYNLCFLKFIAEVVNSPDLGRVTDSLLNKYTNQFIESVIR